MSWKAAKATFMSRHHTSIDFYRAVIEGQLIPSGRQPDVEGIPGLIFRRDELLVIARGHGSATKPAGRTIPLFAKSKLH